MSEGFGSTGVISSNETTTASPSLSSVPLYQLVHLSFSVVRCSTFTSCYWTKELIDMRLLMTGLLVGVCRTDRHTSGEEKKSPGRKKLQKAEELCNTFSIHTKPFGLAYLQSSWSGP